MLKWAKCGQGPTSRGTTLTRTVRKGPDCRRTWKGRTKETGGSGEYAKTQIAVTALAGLAVEGEQPGVEAERSLTGTKTRA